MLLAAAASDTTSGWSVFGPTVLMIVVLLAVRSLWKLTDRREQARREYLNTKQQIDDVITSAKIRMEEVAGMRRQGERRMSDGFGNWRGML